LVIPLEALAIGEEHFELDYYPHWHPVNLVIGERCSGKVGFLGPSIWKEPHEVVTVSPLPITLIRVVSGLLMLALIFLPALLGFKFKLQF